MPNSFHFQQVARLPMPGDNVAIATRRLEAGTQILDEGAPFNLDYTILEGHRFAVRPITAGQALLSWGLPFGLATQPIEPGAYVCNAGILEALQQHDVDFDLPSGPNFADRIVPYVLDEQNFHPARQVPIVPDVPTFAGYRRSPGRGVGTRNYIVLLGTTSRTAGYVRQLEARLKGIYTGYTNIDGIVAVAHTEGGYEPPNNLDLVLRTLAGFVVHPNVGAVLAVDYGLEPITNDLLRRYMADNGYPLSDVLFHFLSLKGGFAGNLEQGETIVKSWLEPVNAISRSQESAAHLKIALQCGGSDAFSGISGNPLVAWVARQIISYGGAANLAETDELIGAETYVLQKVKDMETARRFLATVERFKERIAWHGSTAEGNPSGGNKYRGLYNIVLKSIGAAMKRHPEVRLDGVLEYGQRIDQPGYYFMDSPGNDIESIAGQVATGCNMIFFVTGNGSITNFPFVPTVKIVTTSQRYRLLAHEMDVNAGAYLDGTPMEELGQQTLDLALRVASGARSAGEKAGHTQVQFWRNWRQKDASGLARLIDSPRPAGQSLPLPANEPAPAVQFEAFKTRRGLTTDQVGLILPTSLCAGQIARIAAARLNQKGLGREKGLSRFVSLVHTEGCGVSSGPSEQLYVRTLISYLTHPLVGFGLLLEHGCEKTHNRYIRHQIEQMGLDPEQFGWASVQWDGGIDKTLNRIEDWFSREISLTNAPDTEPADLAALRLGLFVAGRVSALALSSLARLTRMVVGAGGTVVIPQQAELLSGDYLVQTVGDRPPAPSISYGERLAATGFYIMDTPTADRTEVLTGLGATGVEVILTCVGEHPVPAHPLLPVVQVTAEAGVYDHYAQDLDLLLAGDPERWPGQMIQRLVEVVSRQYTPRLARQGNIDFQITRGLIGVSL